MVIKSELLGIRLYIRGHVRETPTSCIISASSHSSTSPGMQCECKLARVRSRAPGSTNAQLSTAPCCYATPTDPLPRDPFGLTATMGTETSNHGLVQLNGASACPRQSRSHGPVPQMSRPPPGARSFGNRSRHSYPCI